MTLEEKRIAELEAKLEIEKIKSEHFKKAYEQELTKPPVIKYVAPYTYTWPYYTYPGINVPMWGERNLPKWDDNRWTNPHDWKITWTSSGTDARPHNYLMAVDPAKRGCAAIYRDGVFIGTSELN